MCAVLMLLLCGQRFDPVEFETNGSRKQCRDGLAFGKAVGAAEVRAAGTKYGDTGHFQCKTSSDCVKLRVGKTLRFFDTENEIHG